MSKKEWLINCFGFSKILTFLLSLLKRRKCYVILNQINVSCFNRTKFTFNQISTFDTRKIYEITQAKILATFMQFEKLKINDHENYNVNKEE